MQTEAHTEEKETSDGPKPSDSNCSSVLLMLFLSDQQTLSYMETIQALSADGALGDTTTAQLTQFSKVSTLSLNPPNTSSPYYPSMSPAQTTPPTHYPKGPTVQTTSYYLPWSSLSMLETSSQTPCSPSQPASSENSEKANTRHPLLGPLTSYAPSSKKLSTPELRPSTKTNSFSTSSRTIDSFPSCFDLPLPSPNLAPSKLTME